MAGDASVDDHDDPPPGGDDTGGMAAEAKAGSARSPGLPFDERWDPARAAPQITARRTEP
jgi:hypothetical protein